MTSSEFMIVLTFEVEQMGIDLSLMWFVQKVGTE